MPATISPAKPATFVLAAALTLAGCGGSAPMTTPGVPSAPSVPSPTGAAGVPTASPEEPAADDVEALTRATDLSGENVYTLGDTAMVENVATLTLLEADRGDSLSSLDLPEAQTAYSFLVEFHWDGRTPGPLQVGEGYYNAINFSLRDDEGFEHPVMQDTTIASRPELLFGYLTAGQRVRGWVTLWGPETTEYVELVYRSVASDPVMFRVDVPG